MEELWDDCAVGVPSAVVVVVELVPEVALFGDDITTNTVPEPSTSTTAITAMSTLCSLEMARLAPSQLHTHPRIAIGRDDAVCRGVHEDSDYTASIHLTDVHQIITGEGLIS